MVVGFYVLHARLRKDYQHDSKRVCHYLKKQNSLKLSSTSVSFQQRKYSMTDTMVQCLLPTANYCHRSIGAILSREYGGLLTTLAYLVVTRVNHSSRDYRRHDAPTAPFCLVAEHLRIC